MPFIRPIKFGRLIQQTVIPVHTFLQNYSVIFIWNALLATFVKENIERLHSNLIIDPKPMPVV